MNRSVIVLCFILAVAACSLLTCHIETAYGPTPYTVTVDSNAILLSQMQNDYMSMKFGMFIHFNMSTFDKCCCENCVSVSGEWGTPFDHENLFHPNNLNCGQWADVAKSAGCKYMVLTSKHHDGFCLWNSQYTTHDVGSSSWGGGKRDVIREFVDSARIRGLKVGLYYSIWDRTNGVDLKFIKGQLTELLTNYGDITCLWFDGWGWMVGYQIVPYDTIRNLIKSIQPKCLIVENNHYFSMKTTDIIQYEMPLDGMPNSNNLPKEGGQPIRTDRTWFWHPLNECGLMPARTIVAELDSVNLRHANYLLDLTPDTNGVMPQCEVDRMKEVGQLRGVTQ